MNATVKQSFINQHPEQRYVAEWVSADAIEKLFNLQPFIDTETRLQGYLTPGGTFMVATTDQREHSVQLRDLVAINNKRLWRPVYDGVGLAVLRLVDGLMKLNVE